MIYDFDVFKFLERYIPIVLRKPRMFAWLKALFQPIVTFLGVFLAFVAFARRQARLNGQVIVLENYLNDIFDSSQRRIKIVDNTGRYFIKNSISTNNAYILSSASPLIIPSLVDFNFSVDFVVKVPFVEAGRAFIKSSANAYLFPYVMKPFIENGSVLAKIERLVKTYKIAGKTFQIDSI